ncbi:MAG: diguanylate cyclase [Chloroflexota bacterium]
MTTDMLARDPERPRPPDGTDTSPQTGGVADVTADEVAVMAGIVGHLPLALFVLARLESGQMVFVSATGGFAEVFGVAPSVAVEDPDTVLRLVHPDDVADFQLAMETSLELGREFVARIRISRPGNGAAWIEVRADPVADVDGRPTWCGYARPLTADESAAITLDAERRRLVGILWSIDAGTWEWNVLTGAARIDERWAGILGYTLDDLRPFSIDTINALMHLSDRVAMDEVVARYFAGGTANFRTTVRMRHRDGHWVWVELRGRLATRTADGTPEWVAGIALDDSDSKATEEQMRRASHYARSLIEASVDPLVTISVDGRIMDVNRATEAATGQPRESLIGSDFSEYFADPDKARAVYRQVFSVGRVVDFPLTIQHAQGGRMEVLYNASTYLDDEGRVAGVFAAARDVTEVRRTQAALEATSRETRLLGQMSDLLQSCQTIEESLPVIEAAMRELFPGSDGRAFLFNTATSVLEETMAWGGATFGSGTINPGDCWALRRTSVHEVGFGAALAPRCHFMPGEIRPYLCMPLMAQGNAMGIVHLIAEDQPAATPALRNLARATADSISLALANIRLRENLQALSTRDPLTGLYNRRFLEEALAREISRSARAKTTGIVAMIDIDHFKRFNDDFGHDAGDAVLVAAAREMLGFRQGSDLACRYGGEEFLIVLTSISVEQAVARLQELRGRISRLTTLYEGLVLPPITVSIGIAPFPIPGHSGADVITDADKALYRAKLGGRNRLEIATGLPTDLPAIFQPGDGTGPAVPRATAD